MKKEKILLLFSGGLDSTYLAWKNLAMGRSVKLVYVECDNYNLGKRTIEEQQAKKIYSLLKNFYNDNVELEVLNIKKNDNRILYDFFKSASKEIVLKDNKITEINLGYIKDDVEDDSVKNELDSRLSDLKFIFGGKIKINFPLLEFEKKDIIQSIPKYLLEQVYSCEAPFFENTDNGTIVTICEQCNPCSDGKKWGVVGITKQFLIVDKKLTEHEISENNKDAEYCIRVLCNNN